MGKAPKQQLIERLNNSVEFAKSDGEDMDEVSWNYQKGILISYNDALLILKALKEKKRMSQTGTCKKCGGETKEGNALYSPPIEGSEGHGTLSKSNSGAVVDCMKCEDCGHSYIDLPESSHVFVDFLGQK